MKRFVLFLVAIAVVAVGCYGKPMPVNDAAPEPCDQVKILFVGDSLLEQSTDAIVAEFGAHGYDATAATTDRKTDADTKLIFRAYGGANVHEYSPWNVPDNGFADPRKELQHELDTYHPDVVVAEWGMNRVDSMWTTGFGWLMPWVVASDMKQVADMVSEANAQLYWTTIPVRDGKGGIGTVFGPDLNDYVNGVVNDDLIHHLGVPLVDWRAAVAPEGGDVFEQFLKYHEDENVYTVREDDGVHLAPAGQDRVAKWTLRDLAPVMCKPTDADPTDSSGQ